MRFRVYDPRDGEWWMYDSCDIATSKLDAYVFDTENADDMANLEADMNVILLKRVRLVLTTDPSPSAENGCT
ncbi:hypothetical protein NVP1081O_198 [Vibrio phage 1.081.O._10N.286.52.C2]|nr:hypothetical protein NVP1081O_198 [Vibrio phage 1.081.O._10N.286.52.C2]